MIQKWFKILYETVYETIRFLEKPHIADDKIKKKNSHLNANRLISSLLCSFAYICQAFEDGMVGGSAYQRVLFLYRFFLNKEFDVNLMKSYRCKTCSVVLRDLENVRHENVYVLLFLVSQLYVTHLSIVLLKERMSQALNLLKMQKLGKHLKTSTSLFNCYRFHLLKYQNVPNVLFILTQQAHLLLCLYFILLGRYNKYPTRQHPYNKIRDTICLIILNIF